VVAFGWTTAEDFLSASVVGESAARSGCAEKPGLAPPAASLALAAREAGVGAAPLEFKVRFEAPRFEAVRFEAVRFAGLETLLVAVLLAGLLGILSATSNPVSVALAVCAAAVVASTESARAGAVSTVAEPEIGVGSAAVAPGLELTSAELLTLGSLDCALDCGVLDCRAVDCVAIGGSVTGAELRSLTIDCCVGNGVVGADVGVGICAGVGVSVCVGAENVSGMTLEAGVVEEARLGFWADDGRGWSRVLLGSDDGAVFVNGVADVGGAVTETGLVSETVCTGVGKTAVAGNGETGVGKTAVGKTGAVVICKTWPGGIEDCIAAVTDCVAMVRNECAASEAA